LPKRARGRVYGIVVEGKRMRRAVPSAVVRAARGPAAAAVLRGVDRATRIPRAPYTNVKSVRVPAERRGATHRRRAAHWRMRANWDVAYSSEFAL
jgi:hypothetical protein